MKLKYLGTAAAEGMPALFCDCEVCKRSRELGGRNIRTRSQSIINDELLIDFSADTYHHFLLHNLPMTKIRSCLITHAHGDHLYPIDMLFRLENSFAHYDNKQDFTVYGDEAAHNAIEDMIKYYDLDEKTIINKRIYPFEQFVTVEGYRITPLRATHDARSTPVIYIIERDGKSLLYYHDSGMLPEESLKYLEAWGGHIDFVSTDCTMGTRNSPFLGHLDFNRNIKLREQMNSIGVTDDRTKWCLNHFSHNGGMEGGVVVYDDFVEIAAKHGFLTSYDGLEVEF